VNSKIFYTRGVPPFPSLRRAVFFLLALGLLPALPAHAASYSYNEEGSEVRFTTRHLGITTASGEFRRFSGTFQFDPERVGDTAVTIDIKTVSVDAKNALEEKLLRSRKFFWSEKHPAILFKSVSIENIRGFTFDIRGELTIRGITRPAVFRTVFYPSAPDAARHPFFRADTLIRRKDYGLGAGNLFDPLIRLTNEELRISLDVTGL